MSWTMSRSRSYPNQVNRLVFICFLY
jgi:hypothetical protein